MTDLYYHFMNLSFGLQLQAVWTAIYLPLSFTLPDNDWKIAESYLFKLWCYGAALWGFFYFIIL